VKYDIDELVAAFRETESDESRGPSFKTVALAIEDEMKTSFITKKDLLEWFGRPDKFDDDVFVYLFDHDQAGKSNDEWYFHFDGPRLNSSGYNVRGINDLSRMKSRDQFTDDS
jgi:hypothetical protein